VIGCPRRESCTGTTISPRTIRLCTCVDQSPMIASVTCWFLDSDRAQQGHPVQSGRSRETHLNRHEHSPSGSEIDGEWAHRGVRAPPPFEMSSGSVIDETTGSLEGTSALPKLSKSARLPPHATRWEREERGEKDSKLWIPSPFPLECPAARTIARDHVGSRRIGWCPLAGESHVECREVSFFAFLFFVGRRRQRPHSHRRE